MNPYVFSELKVNDSLDLCDLSSQTRHSYPLQPKYYKSSKVKCPFVKTCWLSIHVKLAAFCFPNLHCCLSLRLFKVTKVIWKHWTTTHLWNEKMHKYTKCMLFAVKLHPNAHCGLQQTYTNMLLNILLPGNCPREPPTPQPEMQVAILTLKSYDWSHLWKDTKQRTVQVQT